MNKKKIVSAIICACLSMGIFTPNVYAKDDDGKIDLYEVFSNKEDMTKSEVGSCVYKWSMHLPDDAIIFKSDRANNFTMATKSYNSSVELEVNKNKDNMTLEELLYKTQINSMQYGDFNENKEFVVDISKDSNGQKYIRIVKAKSDMSFFLLQDSEEQLKDYVENRIYISNNYIYNLTITMNGDFYKQHKDMFDKLSSSFKTSFDQKNKHIKELSDSVSTTREYKNTSYGWKITMNPYWKISGSPDARNQNFRPVYSDEELEQAKKDENKKEFKVPEGINVKLISSAESGDTASKWAEKEIQKLKNNYNKEVYDILKNESKMQDNIKVQNVVVRYKTVTKNPCIVNNMYVVGNGYKYLLSATMMEDKYKDNKKKSDFENMLNSFKLDKNCFSRYLGKIISSESLIDLESLKPLKMKKYDFETRVPKVWKSFGSRDGLGEDGSFDEEYYRYMESNYKGNISNDEYIMTIGDTSNIRLDMSAGLNANEIKEIICQKAKELLEDNEVRMGLAKVKIESTEHNGAKLYYIEKEYDLEAIHKFVNEDKTKAYDLRDLRNEYTHVIKIGKDIYNQSVNLPVANMTEKNKTKVKSIWDSTSINKVNYSKISLNWKQHKLQEFNKQKTAP